MLVLHIPTKEYKGLTKKKIEMLTKDIENLSSKTSKLKIDDDTHLFLTGDKMEYHKAEEMERMLAIEREIIDAILYNRVIIYLQPIYSVKEFRFTSAEVLTRIQRKDGSIMAPGEFIEAAEQLNLIGDLEDEIIKKTCLFLKEHNIGDLGLDYLEVNLSVKNGETKGFSQKYMRLLAEYGVKPNLVNFEITETATLLQKEHLIENMNTLINAGSHFSLDDFGSGYCNLNYVIDMPIKIVKFDKIMTDTCMVSEKAFSVMQCAVQMAHELGLQTIAEGVETQNAVDRMKEMGVDFIQGYYFARPMNQYEFIKFIKGYQP